MTARSRGGQGNQRLTHGSPPKSAICHVPVTLRGVWQWGRPAGTTDQQDSQLPVRGSLLQVPSWPQARRTPHMPVTGCPGLRG